MTDLDNFFYSDKMLFDEKIYKNEVYLDNNGFYRWQYVYDKYHDRRMYTIALKIFAVISICGLVLGFFLADNSVSLEIIRTDPQHYYSLLTERRILYSVLGYAGFFAAFLLILGLIRLIDGGPAKNWYRMNDKCVQIQPSGRESGINFFEDVKRLELYPDVNEVRMITRFGKCPVMVRDEDFNLIMNFIVSHIPQGTAIQTKRACK